MLLRIGEVHIASCHEAEHGFLSLFFCLLRHCVEQRFLRLGQGQIHLVSGRCAVARVSLFTFQRFIQTDNHDGYIRFARHDHRLAQAVIFICQVLDSVRVNGTAFRIEDPKTVRGYPAKAFQHRDVFGACPVIVSDQGGS